MNDVAFVLRVRWNLPRTRRKGSVALTMIDNPVTSQNVSLGVRTSLMNNSDTADESASPLNRRRMSGEVEARSAPPTATQQ